MIYLKQEKIQMKITRRELRRVIREACDLAAEAEVAQGDDFAVHMEGDVPSPEDYAAVQEMLTQNAWVVNLAIQQVMEMSGAHCERSTVMAIIDFLKSMLEPGELEPPPDEAEAVPMALPIPGLV
jgi:hypothetical protein